MAIGILTSGAFTFDDLKNLSYTDYMTLIKECKRLEPKQGGTDAEI